MYYALWYYIFCEFCAAVVQTISTKSVNKVHLRSIIWFLHLVTVSRMDAVYALIYLIYLE